MNVHCLLHLVHYVRLYGPLWTHSCFPFESLNGKILKMQHGTHHVALQVCVVGIKLNLIAILLLKIVTRWNELKSIDATQETTAYNDASEVAQQLLKNLSGQHYEYVTCSFVIG